LTENNREEPWISPDLRKSRATLMSGNEISTLAAKFLALAARCSAGTARLFASEIHRYSRVQ